MKKNNHIFCGLAIVMMLFSASACLKDNPKSTNFNTVKPVIEQVNSNNFQNFAVTGSANQYSYYMQVRVDSTYTATDSVTVDVGGPLISSNTTVTLGVDTGAFNTFNAANGGYYQLLPAGTYTWTNGNTTVIKAGQGIAVCYLTFKTNLVDFTQPYVLPISITNASGQTISGNYGTIIYTIVPGNQYMGLYQSVGERTMGKNVYTINDLKSLYDLSAIIAIQGSFPTASTGPAGFVPNAVVANAADQTIYLSIGQQMDLTVNPGNTVTVTNDNLYGFGKQTYNIIGGTSTWDPVKHVFTLSYGFVDPYSGDSSVVSEVMTRIR